jgi:hypothetical protein
MATAMVTQQPFYTDIAAPSGVFKFYTSGEWRESASGKTVAILNPYLRETYAKVQGGFREPLRARCSAGLVAMGRGGK